jgi:hypothetical protein
MSEMDMDKVNAKGKSSVSSVQRRVMMATLVKMLTSVPIVERICNLFLMNLQFFLYS